MPKSFSSSMAKKVFWHTLMAVVGAVNISQSEFSPSDKSPGANFMSKKLGVKIPLGRISPNFIKNFPLTFLLEDRFLLDFGEIYSLLRLMKLAPVLVRAVLQIIKKIITVLRLQELFSSWAKFWADWCLSHLKMLNVEGSQLIALVMARYGTPEDENRTSNGSTQLVQFMPSH